MKNRNARRITAMAALVATVLVMLFSTVFLAEHADHNCTDAHCHICMVMDQCSNNLKTIGAALLTAHLICCLFSSRALAPVAFRAVSVHTSLISQKVRMNN